MENLVASRRNWSALAGSVLGIGAVVAYFALVRTLDPGLHRRLEMPVLVLVALAAGLALSLLGVRQAWRRSHRGRLLAPISAGLNLAAAAFFTWYLFVGSYAVPPATRAPAVGAIAPDFALRDHRGDEVRLSALRGRPVVLVFYRGHW